MFATRPFLTGGRPRAPSSSFSYSNGMESPGSDEDMDGAPTSSSTASSESGRLDGAPTSSSAASSESGSLDGGSMNLPVPEVLGCCPSSTDDS